jgi:hypothetical protein
LLEEAFLRILAAETGRRANFDPLSWRVPAYGNNRFGHPDFGPHYVVLAYELSLNRRPTVMLDSQHSVYEWMDEGDLKTRHTVHQFTKAYFQGIVTFGACQP